MLASFLLGGGHGGSTARFTAAAGVVDPGLFGLALISVLWAYDGFADLSLVAGEIAEPQRTLPRAIIGGTLAIVAIYVAANAAYLYLTPIDEMAQSPLIAADTTSALFGRMGVSIVSIVVTISTFGSLIGSMLVGPRVFFAMADDGLFFTGLVTVHPRFKTPITAILFAAVLGVAFVLLGTFEHLADTFVLSAWPFYALAVAAFYRLRARRSQLPRPYTAWGYPLIPAIFLAAVSYLVVNALVTDPLWTGVTFAVVLAGLPVYWLLFATKERQRRIR